MGIKIGDRVRFLNAVGGGIVVKIDSLKKLVYVEDDDGFEVPMLERECLAIGEINEKTNFIRKDFSSKSKTASETSEPIITEKPKPLAPISVVETPEGEVLKVLLAFFPVDIKQLQTTAYDCYLVNDSNYFLYYNIVNGEPGALKSVAHGLMEPNMQEELCSVTKEQLNDWENLRVQLVAFKQGKIYQPQEVLDVKVKLNVVRFYKLHSFTENDYFEELAMMIDIVTEKENAILAAVSPADIKKAMFSKESQSSQKKVLSKPNLRPGITEIDLHISELVDNTTGMSNADMLQLQMDKFHATIEEYKSKKGHKLVFIHGKGEGVLRNEIEKQLKTRYKTYYFQDASFREYGFGATMVTIK